MPQKVGRREKLAEKVERREIYRPVPPPSQNNFTQGVVSSEMVIHVFPNNVLQNSFQVANDSTLEDARC